LNNIQKGLSIFITQENYFPDPSDYTSILYDGDLLWKQGTFGLDTVRQVNAVVHVPIDPVLQNEYTYSLANNKRVYEL